MELREVIEDITKDITASTKQAFHAMRMMPVEKEQSFLSDLTEINADVICLISIMGEYHGAIGVFCPTIHSLKIASSMITEDQKSLNKDMRDAIMEVTNIIAGNVKTRLSGKYGEWRLSIPVFISGKKLNISVPKNSKTDHSIFSTTGSPWLITNFTSENEVFGVGLLLKKTPLNEPECV